VSFMKKKRWQNIFFFLFSYFSPPFLPISHCLSVSSFHVSHTCEEDMVKKKTVV
jgi:hypothetical protein